MSDTWETAVRTAANTMLRYPDKISDGLEAELYALLEKLDTGQKGANREHGHPDDAARLRTCHSAGDDARGDVPG
jgi:hypothetical protein